MEVMQRGFLHRMTFFTCFGMCKLFFLYDLGILDHIDRDVVVNESENI